MVNFTILAGGFAVPGFISTYVFNNDSSTLSLVANSSTGDNPSWIALSPKNSSVLYAVNEIQVIGNLQSFIVNSDDSGSGSGRTVSLVDTASTNGIGPTFTNPLSTGEASAMNFGSTNASFIATSPDDLTRFVLSSDPTSDTVTFPIPSGGKSNPHMSLEVKDEVFISDLGADTIWRLSRTGANGSGEFAVQGQIARDPGSGPRRMAVYNDILFVVSETTSTLTAQRIPALSNSTDVAPLLANVSTFPSDALPGSKFAAAELLISTPTEQFPNPLIYVSNRNIGDAGSIDPKGDTIAVFEFVNGTGTGAGSDITLTPAPASNANAKRMKRITRSSLLPRQSSDSGFSLNLLSQNPTGLQQIRSMALGNVADGGDAYIIAGANTEGGVAVLQRVDGGRNLTVVASNLDVANRTSFVFI